MTPTTETTTRPTLRQRRSGNPQVRSGAIAPASSPVSRDEAPKPRRTRLGTALRVTAVALAVALYTTVVLFLPAAASSNAFIYAMLALVPLVTVVFVREARTRGLLRWPTVWFLSLIVTPGWVLPVLFVGQAWVLSRFWVIESGPQRPEFWPTRRR